MPLYQDLHNKLRQDDMPRKYRNAAEAGNDAIYIRPTPCSNNQFVNDQPNRKSCKQFITFFLNYLSSSLADDLVIETIGLLLAYSEFLNRPALFQAAAGLFARAHRREAMQGHHPQIVVGAFR